MRRLPVVDVKSVPFECATCKTVVLVPPIAWLLCQYRLRARSFRCPVCRDRFREES